MDKKNGDKDKTKAKRPQEFTDLLNNLFMPTTNSDDFKNKSDKKKKSD
ncbi:MAG: hypothetical protein KAG14_00905 [Mycoplasmataceae bacterium]|nr:hypothetical protein [Mycoplasmataceae bacterium]